MNAFNPYSAPEAAITDLPSRRASPQSFPQAIKRGAWLGLKWTTLVTGPLALLMLLLGLGIVGFGVISGRLVPSFSDESTRAMLLGPFGFYLVSCGWGIIIGSLVVPIAYLIRVGRTRVRS